MFEFFTNRKFLIIFGGVVLFVFIVSLILKPSPQLPQVTKTKPINSTSNVNYFDPITYSFSQDIDPNLLTLSSIPEESWQKEPKNNHEIVFTSKQYLQVNTQYVLTLSYQSKPVHTLTFTTLPQQSDPRYIQEVNNELARDYPLAVKTPLERPGFTVVYSKPLTLEITLKNEGAERDIIINAVRDWVKENGLDPNSHSYTLAN